MSFNQKYQKIFDTVREDINKINLFEGIELPEPLKSKLSEILNAPSKRIRPLVAFLYVKALGFEIDEKQTEFQTAIELAHNASLIHDDIIDGSSTRRGKQTLNDIFDAKLAVIAGDYLLALAFEKVLKIAIPELTEMFRKTFETMTKGEVQQYFDKNKITTIEEYIRKSEQKTASLFETAVQGAVLIGCHSGALAEESQKTCDFAKNFGIAFQIRDDLINCKTSKSDFDEGIFTAPVIFSGKKEINDNGLEKTVNLLNNYIDKAVSALENIEENTYKTALKELLELLRND